MSRHSPPFIPVAALALLVFAGFSARAQSLTYDQRLLHIMALRTSMTDAVGPGYCGRGVFSVLSTLGLGDKIQSANGEDWFAILKSAGWRAVRCNDPARSPLGSVLVYLSDRRLYGRNIHGTAGGNYGHVEFVALDGANRRWYVSDKPRHLPGGSVPENFTRIAWLPPDAPLTPVFSRARSYVAAQGSTDPVFMRAAQP